MIRDHIRNVEVFFMIRDHISNAETFVKRHNVDCTRVYLDSTDKMWRHRHNNAVCERITLLWQGWEACRTEVRTLVMEAL